MELLEWDAEAYDGLPLPHTRWGAGVLDRLDVADGDTVLELGAGTGRDAAALLSRRPSVSLIAVDGSRQMLEQYRSRIASPDQGERGVRTLHADLREPLGLSDVAERAFSVATFHWLPDHRIPFASVAEALRPGGRFVAEAGGIGNIATVRAALRDLGVDDGGALWNFAAAEPTADLLRAAGFIDVDVRIAADPAEFETREQVEAYLAIVVLGAYLRDLPADQHRRFVGSVADRLPGPVVDYSRLQISARLP